MMLAILLLGLLWSVGVSNLIPCKTLLNISVKCSSFLPMWRFLYSTIKERAKPFAQRQIHKPAFRQAEIPTYITDREDGRKTQGELRELKSWFPLTVRGSALICFLNVALMHYWWLCMHYKCVQSDHDWPCDFFKKIFAVVLLVFKARPSRMQGQQWIPELHPQYYGQVLDFPINIFPELVFFSLNICFCLWKTVFIFSIYT